MKENMAMTKHEQEALRQYKKALEIWFEKNRAFAFTKKEVAARFAFAGFTPDPKLGRVLDKTHALNKVLRQLVLSGFIRSRLPTKGEFPKMRLYERGI